MNTFTHSIPYNVFLSPSGRTIGTPALAVCGSSDCLSASASCTEVMSTLWYEEGSLIKTCVAVFFNNYIKKKE